MSKGRTRGAVLPWLLHSPASPLPCAGFALPLWQHPSPNPQKRTRLGCDPQDALQGPGPGDLQCCEGVMPSVGLCSPGASGGQTSGGRAGAYCPGGLRCWLSEDLEQLTSPSTFPLQPLFPTGLVPRPPVRWACQLSPGYWSPSRLLVARVAGAGRGSCREPCLRQRIEAGSSQAPRADG